MYITCHECNTVFRLDERRLKPAGSKVRCSQCGNIFTAFPPMPGAESQPPALVTESAPPLQALTPSQPDPVPESETARMRNQLEGIDPAALNAVLSLKAGHDAKFTDPGVAVDEGDLDLDFDMDLSGTRETAPVSDPMSGSAADLFDDADLEMDFEIDDGLDEQVSPAIAARDALAEDLAAHAKSKAAENPAVDGGGMSSDAGVRDESGFENLELDLDFDLDDHASESQPAGEAEMSLESAAAPFAGADETEFGDLDLTDLGDLLEAADMEPAPKSSEEVELELDLAGDTIKPAGMPSGEDLDNLDIKLDPFDHLEPEAEEEIEDIDLSPATADDMPRKPDAATPEDDFDLGDLAAVLEQDDGRAYMDEDVDELELELDHSDAESQSAETESLDELDLSDLDDLGLQEGGTSALQEASGDSDADDEDLEELDFELDAEFENKPIAKQGKGIEFAQEDPELDLSDIEEMLEGDGLTIKSDPAPNTAAGLKDLGDLGEIDLGEIDLDDFDKAIDDSVEEPLESFFDGEEPELALAIGEQDEGADKEVSEDPMDLDLDIVATMAPMSHKTADAVEVTPISEDDELTLDLEMENEAGKTLQPVDGTEDEFDLSDLGDLVEEPAARRETIDTGDIELEFEIEDVAEPIIAQTAARVSRPINEMTADRIEAIEPAQKKSVGRPRPVKKKKGAGKFLIFLLVLAMLGGGGYYGYEYVVKNDIQIPYLSEYINPQPSDPEGIALLSTLDINSKFIENEQSGRLFIITGKVRNSYPDLRSMIQLRGKLYSTGKILVKTEQVFAGQILTDQELATKPIAEITRQLAQAPGPQTTMARVLPGQDMPFMVAFSELPDNLDEFAIELVYSQKAQ
jgi:pilus assembly protein FimV